jgi:hypothetical protein
MLAETQFRKSSTKFLLSFVATFGGLLVIVLAIVLKVRGFKRGRGLCIFNVSKRPCPSSIGGEL